MLKTLQLHAARHALMYAIALGLGLQALCTGFYDNFWPIEPADMARLGWWQILAAGLKSVSFSIGIVVGYLIKSPANGAETKSETSPPFAPPPSSPSKT